MQHLRQIEPFKGLWANAPSRHLLSSSEGEIRLCPGPQESKSSLPDSRPEGAPSGAEERDVQTQITSQMPGARAEGRPGSSRGIMDAKIKKDLYPAMCRGHEMIRMRALFILREARPLLLSLKVFF